MGFTLVDVVAGEDNLVIMAAGTAHVNQTLRTRGRQLFAATLVVLLVACEYPPNAVEVHNDSSVTVHLYEVVEQANTRLDLGTLHPGTGFITRAECLGDLLVTSEAGEELARREGPLCQGQPPWIITDNVLAGD